MSKEMSEWELDWWWIDVIEDEVEELEKQEARWLLEKSESSSRRYESWRSLRKKIKKSDAALKLQWEGKYFDDLKDKIMDSIEAQHPQARPRP